MFSSTDSSLSHDLQIFKQRDKENLQSQDLINLLSPDNSLHIFITLNVSYAYSNKTAQYVINTKIINSAKVSLNRLLEGLSNYISLSSYLISYSDNEGDVYFFCGKYPLDNEIVLCELTQSRTLWLKLRPDLNTDLKIKFDLYEEEREENSEKNDYDNDNAKNNYHINANSSRAKERILGDIIKSVHLWFQLHKGVIGRNGCLIKLTYEESAEFVEISKKTLSNYHEQLKLGKFFGFDFNKNKKSKVHILKKFIKSRLRSINTSTLRRVKSKKNKVVNSKKREAPKPMEVCAGLTVIDDAFTFEELSE